MPHERLSAYLGRVETTTPRLFPGVTDFPQDKHQREGAVGTPRRDIPPSGAGVKARSQGLAGAPGRGCFTGEKGPGLDKGSGKNLSLCRAAA
jgi:hypothetical protein